MTDTQLKYKLTLGRDEICDIRIGDISISKEHLNIHYLNKDQLRLVDLDSDYGTYVDNRRVKSFLFKRGSELRIGNRDITDTDALFHKTRGLYRNLSNDYTEDIQDLKPIFKEFDSKKRRISTLIPFLIRILGLITIPIVFLYLGTDFNPNYRIVIYSIVGLFTSLIALYGALTGKRAKKLSKLRLEYEEKLRCPNMKCKMPMINHNWAYWEGRESCPQCNVLFNNIDNN